MNNYNELLINLPKIHTTELGYERIKNNLNIGDSDVVNYCKNLINDSNCEIVQIGKNWYCKLNNICITVNAYQKSIKKSNGTISTSITSFFSTLVFILSPLLNY